MTIDNLTGHFKQYLMEVLPTSPFQQFIQALPQSKGFNWLNWLVPVHDILVVLGVYLVAVGLFYLYSIIMRWVKVIGD